MSGFLARDERALSAVPGGILSLLAVAIAAQIGWHWVQRTGSRAASDLPPPASAQALRLASFGEPAALARLAMVWLQNFDSRGDNDIPYQQLDYARLAAWLHAIQATDARSGYPLFVAARVYAENPTPAKARLMLEFIAREFDADPNRRWPALAHAALIAKHRLKDLPLARRYASMVQRLATDESVPLWARQMEVFILEDMNELEAAKVMLGGMLATGRIRDPDERRFLEGRLEEIARRIDGAPLKQGR